MTDFEIAQKAVRLALQALGLAAVVRVTVEDTDEVQALTIDDRYRITRHSIPPFEDIPWKVTSTTNAFVGSNSDPVEAVKEALISVIGSRCREVLDAALEGTKNERTEGS